MLQPWIKLNLSQQICLRESREVCASIEPVGHQFEAIRGGRQLNGLHFGGADVNAVMSHVGEEYGTTRKKLHSSNYFAF